MERGLDKLRKKKEVLAQLLKIESELQKRKTELQDDQAKNSKLCLSGYEGSNTVDDETKAVFDKIYPILKDIHTEEVHLLELKNQIELNSAVREKERIRHCLRQVCERCGCNNDTTSTSPSSQILLSWIQELRKCTSESGSTESTVSDVDFSSQSLKETNDHSEKLSFSVSFKGFYVWVTMENATNLPSELKVTSDPYIPGLEVKVREACTHQLSVNSVLSYIHTTIDTDILPYL